MIPETVGAHRRAPDSDDIVVTPVVVWHTLIDGLELVRSEGTSALSS
ncbi:MAG: hypothetical protein RIE73_14190 [Coleofasciculus sp. C1-SOL-03]